MGSIGDLRRQFSDWLLAVVVAGCALFFCVATEPMFGGPCGPHFIRQTDSLAFVVRFREFTANLFSPGVFDLRNAPDAGASAGEFPLFYWVLGMAERLVGPMPTALRWVNASLVVIANAILARTLATIFHDRVLGLTLIAVITGSPVLAFYAFNFLPDAGAYALIILGWSTILPGLFNDKVEFKNSTLVFFVVAGMIKAPMALYFVAWCGTLLWAWGKNRENWNSRNLISLGTGAAMILAWHGYAGWYNALHHSHYFLTWSEPFWEMNTLERGRVMDLMWNYWWTKYLHPTVWHVTALLALLVLARHRRIASSIRVALSLALIGTVCFLFLFFRKFADHDYYFITILPALVLLLVTGIKVMIELTSTRILRVTVTGLVSILAISSLLLARKEVVRRAWDDARDYSSASPFLDGIRSVAGTDPLPFDARVIVLGDSSTNAVLSALGRNGWTFPGFPMVAEPSLPELRRAGATHLLSIDSAGMTMNGMEPMVRRPGWSLWKVTR